MISWHMACRLYFVHIKSKVIASAQILCRPSLQWIKNYHIVFTGTRRGEQKYGSSRPNKWAVYNTVQGLTAILCGTLYSFQSLRDNKGRYRAATRPRRPGYEKKTSAQARKWNRNNETLAAERPCLWDTAFWLAIVELPWRGAALPPSILQWVFLQVWCRHWWLYVEVKGRALQCSGRIPSTLYL